TILETRAVHKTDNKLSEDNLAAKKSKSKSKSSSVAYSYVSFVNGEINKDKTWALCESRVKGKSGAKFKKVFSESEEAKVVAKFLD
ncbi:viroplasmin family protein, partial [Lacticaseibacillus paracasei]